MKTYLTLLLACTGLAACGGGGGGGGSSPAPVASAPAPTNASLTNLTASQSFATAGGSLNSFGNSNGTVGPTSLVGAGVDGIGVAYNASSQSYTITANIGSQSFAPSNRDAGQSTSLITVYSKTNGAVEDQLVLANGGAAGFTYSNFGAWTRVTSSATASPAHNSFFVYGIPTPASDLPRTGSATYATVGGGIWVVSNQVLALNGVGSLTANFGTGTVQTTMDFGRSNLGVFNGSATINSADASFSGSIGGSTLYTGALAGRFYGPAAAEVGAGFTMTNGTGYIDAYMIGKK